MSQKLDIFETERGFLIYDGIYSDSSIKNTQLVKSEVIEFGLHTILVRVIDVDLDRKRIGLSMKE